MLKKLPHDRSVHVSKIDKDQSTSLVKRKDEELLLGEIHILGLDMESLRNVLYLKKSAKSGIKKGNETPYNLKPGEKIISNFIHEQRYYQMLVEIMEARTQKEVVRPIDSPREEEGLHADLVDYSVGAHRSRAARNCSSSCSRKNAQPMPMKKWNTRGNIGKVPLKS